MGGSYIIVFGVKQAFDLELLDVWTILQFTDLHLYKWRKIQILLCQVTIDDTVNKGEFYTTWDVYLKC